LQATPTTQDARKRCAPLPANYGILYESVFGVSPEVSIRVVKPEVGPWIVTITVKESLTGKPIQNVKIVADTGEEAVTDAIGQATLTLTGGARKLTFSKSGYKTKTWAGLITADVGIGVSLIPFWMIGVGIASVASIGVFVGAKLLWRK